MEWVNVCGCLLVGLYLRLLPYPIVITKNAIQFFAQDPYYHARRIQLALTNHWIIPTYDSYSGFPQGLYCFWSNLFDYSILWTGLLIGMGHPTVRQLEIITAFAPVIWGILSLIPAYLLIKKVFDSRVALLSIFFISILPGHIYQTILGRADHYGADAFFPLFMFYFLINALTGDDEVERHWQSFYAGICAVLSWLVWPGSTIFVGTAIGYILIQSIFDYRDGLSQQSCLKTGLFFLFIAWITLTPFCLTSYWGKHGAISYDSISWFQWIFLLLAMCLYTLLIYVQKYFKSKVYSSVVYLIGLVVSIGIITIFTLLFLPDFSDSFLSGLGWVGKTDPWLQTITEFQPLFISIGVFSTFRAITFFSYVIYLLPIIYFVLFWSWFVGGRSRPNKYKQFHPEGCPTHDATFSPARLWFIIYFVVISFLGLYQTRFSHFFVLIVAVGLSLLWVTFWDKCIGFRFQVSGFKFLYLVSCILLLYLLLSPVFQEIRSIQSKYAIVPYPWKETLQWIKDNTPQTSYFDQPYREPEYGILAPWIAGHWINYIAQRPTLANGFHTNSKNNQTSMEFFLTEDINESKTILEDNKIRYVILSDITPSIQGYARVLGKDDSDYIFESIYHPPQGGTQILFQPTLKFNHLISSQLYLNDGVGLSPSAAKEWDAGTPGCYRLVYETPEQWNMENKKVNEIKVFEYVKGAVVRGMAKSGTHIHLSVPIKTNSGRNFLYQQDIQAASSLNSSQKHAGARLKDTSTEVRDTLQGVFQFIVPYSQSNESSHAMEQTHATAPYSIQIGKKVIHMDIDEKTVTQGKIVILPQ